VLRQDTGGRSEDRARHQRYRELNTRFLAIASTMGAALREADSRKTTEIVRRLSEDVNARSERLSWLGGALRASAHE
jgi:hypothetical protein